MKHHRKGRNKMERKTLAGITLAILLTAMLTLAFDTFYVKADGSWTWVMDTVTGAYGEAVVGTGDAVYIARKSSFYRYLPADNSFVELASPPSPDGYAFKTGTALAWDFGDYIYALYGAATGDSRRWFYRYSISNNSWEALAQTPADQGEGNAMTWVGLDNSIYATIGGEQRPTYLVRYDPSTNSWSDAPADPPAGMGDGASLVWTGGEFLYALRGEFYESLPLYDFWRYSLTNDVWTTMADIPAWPWNSGSGGVGDGGSLLYVGFWLSNQTDYIYALSGNQAHPDGIPDNRTYRYTISMNSWERLADLPFGVGYYVGCRLAYADGHIYAWQGAPSTWPNGGDDLASYLVKRVDIAVTNVTVSKTVVGQGYALYIHTTVENQGDLSETFNVTAYYNETAITLPDGKDHKTITLTSGESEIITFTWNTTDVAYGNYTISAAANIVSGETDTADNSLVNGAVVVTVPGDVNGDRVVDIFDVGYISAHWYPGPPTGPLGYDPNADINNDGAVDIFDIGIASAHWEQTW